MHKSYIKITLILIVILINFYSCKKNEINDFTLKKKVKLLLKINNNYYDKNIRIWNLKSRAAIDEEGKNYIIATKVEANFYNKKNKLFLTIKSNKAKIIKNTNDIYFIGKSNFKTNKIKGYAFNLSFISKEKIIKGKNLRFYSKNSSGKANNIIIYPQKELSILNGDVVIITKGK